MMLTVISLVLPSRKRISKVGTFGIHSIQERRGLKFRILWWTPFYVRDGSEFALLSTANDFSGEIADVLTFRAWDRNETFNGAMRPTK